MRRKTMEQQYLDFTEESTLKVVKEFQEKYKAISQLLDANPEILQLAHNDCSRLLSRSGQGREAKYTTEQMLRALVVMFLEQASYRDAVIRIDGSAFLRHFVRLGVKPTMDFTFLSRAFGCLSPKTWQAINERLSAFAVQQKKISGEKLRVDTTAVESDIHYPTDSSLLWDGFRTVTRLLRGVQQGYPSLAGRHRFHDKKVKRRYLFIGRNAGSQSKGKKRKVKTTYRQLVEDVRRVVEIAQETVVLLPWLEPIRELLCHFIPLVQRVIEQTERRVFNGETVPADQKVYSIFQEHTELLKRGKARKPIEFGHMVLLTETREKFISQYQVMEKKRHDKDLLTEALETHQTQFGTLPEVLAADKGFYESMKVLRGLEKQIQTVSICKKGSRNSNEKERERTDAFRDGQRFRAGIE